MNDESTRRFPKITERGLEDLQKRIGVKIGAMPEPWCYEATRDNIRHYANGIGDDNPARDCVLRTLAIDLHALVSQQRGRLQANDIDHLLE